MNLICFVIFMLSTIASAEEPHPEASPGTDPVSSGIRRRTGISLLVGSEKVSDDFGNHLSATMYGFDTRWGVQLNDHVGIYVPLHISIGHFREIEGSVLGVPAGLTGTLAATVVADYTLMDRFFVGAGAGIGILNYPHGPTLHLRVGGYPLMKPLDQTERRRGLSVSGDLRLVFVDGLNTTTIPTLSVGYDSF